MTYFFSMLRFVPDPARGEFVNIGAIAGDEDSQDWELRLISNLKRARSIDHAAFLPHALEVAGEFQDRLATEDLPAPQKGWLTWSELRSLSGEMNNILQLSAPAPIDADSAEGALDVVFDELVLDPAARRFRFEKKHRAVTAIRQAYRAVAVPDEYVRQHVVVASGAFKSPFDFAIQNGRAVQLVQCWSFQLPNQDELADQVKAWAWTMHELRRHGGELRLNGAAIDLPQELDVGVVYIPPTDDGDSSAFEEARAAFDEVGVTQVTPEHAEDLARAAADALHVTAEA